MLSIWLWYILEIWNETNKTRNWNIWFNDCTILIHKNRYLGMNKFIQTRFLLYVTKQWWRIKKKLLDYRQTTKEQKKESLRKSFKMIRGLFHKYSAMLSFNKYKNLQFINIRKYIKCYWVTILFKNQCKYNSFFRILR